MKQREVTDSENTRWTCVQSYSMGKENATEKAAELTEKNEEKVTVVCTPTGGAKTVRLELAPGWEQQLTDESLVQAIAEHKE